MAKKSKILVVERLIPPGNEPFAGKLIDLVEHPQFAGDIFNKIEVPENSGKPLILTFSRDWHPLNEEAEKVNEAELAAHMEQVLLYTNKLAEEHESHQ